MELRKGNIYYYGKRIVVEYIGLDKKGDYAFESTNGRIIIVKKSDLGRYISE